MSENINYDIFEFEKDSSKHPMTMDSFHKHDTYEIYFLESGTRHYIIGNKNYDIKKYDVVLILPNVLHKTTGNAYKRKLIEFSKEYLSAYYTTDTINSMLKCFSYDDSVLHLTKEQFEYVNALLEKIRYRKPELCYALFGEILLFLSGILPQKSSIERSSLSGNLPAAVIRYIDDNYTEIDSIDVIAEHFHITKYHLCRIFKKNTGLTVINYINKLKVEHVKQLLLSHKKKSVTDIAIESGFNSPIYMSRIFKQITGLSPSEYRNECLSKPGLFVID